MSDDGYEVEPASLKSGLLSALLWTAIIFFALTTRQDPAWLFKTLFSAPFLVASAVILFALQRLCRVRIFWFWEFFMILGVYYLLTRLIAKLL